jgi:hypothetical protein
MSAYYPQKIGSEKRPQSPSRRRLSSVERKDEGLSISPDEIDEIIVKWYQARKETKELEEKERRYKLILNKVLDLTGGDVIKGRDLQVIRRVQKRRFLLKANVPAEIYERYSTVKNVQSLHIRELAG